MRRRRCIGSRMAVSRRTEVLQVDGTNRPRIPQTGIDLPDDEKIEPFQMTLLRRLLTGRRRMLYILTAGQQLRDPAASGILFAKTQGCNNHWDTDEGAGDGPEGCPREDRNENYERRNGQSHARDT